MRDDRLDGPDRRSRACDGPRENAGENADFAAGEVGSNDTLRQGPAERSARLRTSPSKRAEEAKEAEAKALEAQADETALRPPTSKPMRSRIEADRVRNN